MVNLLDPVPLAVIVLIVTSVIIAVVLLTSGKKETPAPTSKPVTVNVPAVETKRPKVEEISVPEETEVNALDDVPVERVVWEELEGVRAVEEVDDLEVESSPEEVESTEQELQKEIPAFVEQADETEDDPLELQSEPVEDEIVEENEHFAPEHEIVSENTENAENNEEAEEEEIQDDHEQEYEEELYEGAEEEGEEVAEYDEADYNPEDVDQYEQRDSELSTQENHNTNNLTLDTTNSADSTSPRSPTKRTPGSRSTQDSLSPMNNSSSYKFGSHYQHKKVGDSWVKNSNTAASAAAASPVTVSPIRHAQPRKVIPVSDQEQPLSRKQSTKISQYEEGLQAEKTKVSNKVQETRRRTIEDVVNRVLLDGELPAEVDPAALIGDPEAGVDVKTKQIVKEMKAKFGTTTASTSGASNGASGASSSGSNGANGSSGRSVSVDEE